MTKENSEINMLKFYHIEMINLILAYEESIKNQDISSEEDINSRPFNNIKKQTILSIEGMLKKNILSEECKEAYKKTLSKVNDSYWNSDNINSENYIEYFSSLVKPWIDQLESMFEYYPEDPNRQSIIKLKNIIKDTEKEINIDNAEISYRNMVVSLLNNIEELIPISNEYSNLTTQLTDLSILINNTNWNIGNFNNDCIGYFRELTKDWINSIESILRFHR